MSTPTPLNDGGLAFPYRETEASGQFQHHYGMSLRDWFASQADIPYDTVCEFMLQNGKSPNEITIRDVLKFRAELKYAEADEMLKAREAKP